MAKKFTKLSKGGGGSADDRVKYVTYMDRGAELIKYPVIEGDTARDPVAKGYIEKPTKEPTESTVYTQSGWSKTDGGAPDSTALQNVTEDRTVYAAYTESARKYTVNFYDGDTLVHTEQVGYGGSSSYRAEKEGYFFGYWEPAPENITSDMNCYARWIESVDFATASWSEIAWVCENGLAQQMFAIGDKRSIKFDGSNRSFEIIAFDHDDLADGSGKASITMLCKTLLYDSEGMNSTATNVGGWGACEFRTTLASKITTMPADLQAVIKTVKKAYNLSSNSSDIQYAEDKLWIPSHTEMGLSTMKSGGTATPTLGQSYGIEDASFGIKNTSSRRYYTRHRYVPYTSYSEPEFTAVYWEKGASAAVTLVETSAKANSSWATPAYHVIGFCI